MRWTDKETSEALEVLAEGIRGAWSNEQMAQKLFYLVNADHSRSACRAKLARLFAAQLREIQAKP